MDLLLETEKLEWLVQHIDAKNFARTCLYLTSCCAYLPEDDDSKVMQTAYKIYTKEKVEQKLGEVPSMLERDLLMSPLTCHGVHCRKCARCEESLPKAKTRSVLSPKVTISVGKPAARLGQSGIQHRRR